MIVYLGVITGLEQLLKQSFSAIAFDSLTVATNAA